MTYLAGVLTGAAVMGITVMVAGVVLARRCVRPRGRNR